MESLKYKTDPTAGTNTAARIGRPELRVWLLGNFPRHRPCRSLLVNMHGVLNKVYLQNFLHGWAVNRETNLMSLLNP